MSMRPFGTTVDVYFVKKYFIYKEQTDFLNLFQNWWIY